ncbi:Crp/Fnr family transcriptional regulator [Noviherbaspirillum saxi]|uniref:Crp/Fnr family transcriptional regulator n=1 Tax=Noviherbaspirillum saxi TaxID=2320863 RepID=A0A3A3FU88_9BURK|nr:Crp/Fnr family transcriptional regulator [Noviherbaspirillum saxi]RJF99787.1 Crp/Fnr family transcriptional regulator [Noviherbaspirillum saxi]
MQYLGFNWIETLGPEARKNLLDRARLRKLPDSTILYRQGDITHQFFQILDGSIRKYVLDDAGQEVLLYVYGKGDVVADSSALDRSPYPVTIATQGETLLRVWTVQDLIELRAVSPVYDIAIATQACHRLRGTLQIIQELVTLPVASRVASHLVILAEHQYLTENGQELELSQADLGLMIGTTRQTVSAIVNELKREGFIETRYGKIIVKNLAGLREYSSRARKAV